MSVLTPKSAGEHAGAEQDRRSSASDRRRNSRSGRRKGDRRWPWWRQGVVFAAVCAVLRCWRWFRRTERL